MKVWHLCVFAGLVFIFACLFTWSSCAPVHDCPVCSADGDGDTDADNDCDDVIIDAGDRDGDVDGDGDTCVLSVECGDERCSDGVDNDCDGYADCDDWDCEFDVLSVICEERETSHATIDLTIQDLCSDDADTDGDGYADCADRDCRWHPDIECLCFDGGECDDERCSDGLDNNDDGHIDCDDWECRFNHRVTVCAHLRC